MVESRFQVGDRIRLVAIPQSVLDMPPHLRDGVDGTLTAFRFLMEKNEIHEVVEIDPEFGWPWIAFETQTPDGTIYYHKVNIEPECVELISGADASSRSPAD